MSLTSRRIFLYWLLLLVPTLVIGGVAIQLLRREQARLAGQGAEAVEARRAAVGARARLMVENVELLVGDVEDGVLDALGAAPVQDLDAFLDRWEKSTTLVRIAFRSSADGRLLRPSAAAAEEEARGFRRRFSRLLVESPPWQVEPSGSGGAKDQPEKKALADNALERKQVASNVAQVQSARRDVQELFKARESASSLAVAPAAEATGAMASDDAVQRIEIGKGRSKVEADGRRQVVVDDLRRSAPVAAPSSLPRLEERKRLAENAPVFRAKENAVGQRGWAPLLVDGRLHLLGWTQPGRDAEVRGVELELASLVSRLGGVLPAEIGRGEGYALRDDQGRVLHQVGAIPPVGGPAARVPLAMALLPGWDVVAYFASEYEGTPGGAGLLWLGVLLVAIFVTAIVAGGSLLLRQARRSEEEAVQKTSFVANVSHEFKTPLTTIRLYSELLEQGRVRDAAQGSDYLRTIGRETQRLARLVNNALDFSRLEQGRKKYAREPLDLSVALGQLLDTHAPRVAEAGLVLQRGLPAGPLPVTTDRDALEQIVINLIDNACKYAAAGGEVTVAATPRPAGGGEVRVADRGPGVPVGHREQIFEKFHRVDDALTAEKTGAGLGLSIARQLARGLGGELQYEPRPGGGAEFILELP